MTSMNGVRLISWTSSSWSSSISALMELPMDYSAARDCIRRGAPDITTAALSNGRGFSAACGRRWRAFSGWGC
jgi:hypothetical protein